jgi:alpha-tubulin suppressor-like RCC1 family protein
VGGTNWKLVACGQRSSAAIKTDGTLWTWGENEYGQLGDNTTTHKSSPVQTVAGGTNWKQVSCGSAYTAAIKSDGTLWMCGYNNLGQLGDNTITKKSSPVQTVAGGTNWKQVACGRWHTAAIKSDGTLWGWGRNNGGPLGDNTITTKSSPVQTIAGGTNWKHVSCGGEHTVAVKTDGTLWGWGYCGYGQLGDNTTANKSSPVQTITGGTSWRWVAAGLYHTAAIKTDGTMWLWGYNTNGQLGDNTTTRKSSPVQTIIGGTNWKMVAAGMYNTTAIQESSTPYVTNVAIAGTTSTTMLSSYTYTATMTYNNGTTSTDCTLLNWSAGGGTGSSTITGVTSSNVTVSMDLDGTDSLTASTTTGVTKTLSLTTSGFSATLWGWGYNGQGQLGDNTRTSQLSPVQTIAGGTNWKQVSGGSQFTAAVKSDGTLWTWGYNAQGGLGTNNTTRVSSPVQTVAGGTNWKQVSCGLYHMSAIKTNGTLWSCGYNHKGQLGDNTITKKSSPVQTVAGGTNWKQVSGGQYHTAAIKTDGTLWTWGYNPHGALGNNTFNDTSSPAQTITGGTNWKQVSCGYSHTAAIKTDGTLWMIGNNTTGQLGDGTIVRKPSPVQTVSGGTNWRQVATGYQHTAAIKTDGTVWAWGDGSLGSLGDNTSVRKSSPVQTISGGTNWKQVSCFNFQTAGIKSDGTLWTWGYNNYGQLGDNTSVNKSSPVQTAAGGINWKYVACGYINTYGLS